LKENRLSQIADFISKKTNVSLKELADKFNVSIFTIRRDVDELIKREIVIKHYGGVSINNLSVASLVGFEDRNSIYHEQKTRIAKVVSEHIQDNEVIFIDSGTTTMYIANYIKDKKITVITNNIYVIIKLYMLDNINLIVIGGELDHRTNSLFGFDIVNFLDNLTISRAFLGTSGISLENGLTNYTFQESGIKKKCVEISNKSYILADPSKFDKSSLIKFAKISDIDYLATCKDIPKKYVEYCEKNGVEIIYG